MAIGFETRFVTRPNQFLSSTWRNRAVAFAPIGVALLGVAVMAAVGLTREPQTSVAAEPTIDSIITGTVSAGE